MTVVHASTVNHPIGKLSAIQTSPDSLTTTRLSPVRQRCVDNRGGESAADGEPLFWLRVHVVPADVASPSSWFACLEMPAVRRIVRTDATLIS